MITSTISNAISLMRFVLPLFVVAMHVNAGVFSPDSESVEKIGESINLSILMAAVPLFFAMSGFLFEMSSKSYSSKIRGRCNTLLLPYLAWNTLCSFWFLLLAHLKLASSENIFANIGLSEFFILSFGLSVPVPLDFPLWFVRDLFLACLLYPLFSLFLKTFPRIFLSISFAIYLFGTLFADIFMADSFPHSVEMFSKSSCTLFFFPLGIFLAMRSDKFSAWVENLNFKSIFSFATAFILLVCISYVALMEGEQHLVMPLRRTSVFLGVIVFAIGAFLLTKRGYYPSKDSIFVQSSFFVFAGHFLLLSVVPRLVLKFIRPMLSNPFILQFLSIAIIYALLMATYCAMRKLMPRVLFVLDGR